MSATAEHQPPAERNETRRLRVYRFKRGDGAERFDEFEVPVGPHTTILDALRWIQLNRDPSLALRHSCLHASCGTCGVQVDGREELACACSAHDQGEQITVEPLANLPILTDLVVDMRAFFARFPDEHPVIRASEVLPDAQPPEGVDEYVRLEDCIECGLCLSACPVAATSHTTSGRPRSSPRSGCSKSLVAPIARTCSRGQIVPRRRGAATPASSAPGPAPPTRSRPSGSWHAP